MAKEEAKENPIPTHPITTSLADILKPLSIGRVRDKHRPRPGRGGRPNRRRSTPTPDEDDHVHGDEDVSHSTTPSPGGSLAKTTPGMNVDEMGDLTGDGETGHDFDDHDHATDHDDFTCQPTSSQHSAYIRDNLELLQKKCNEFQECTKEVYSAENFHRILAGGNIQLTNMCGLMYPNGWEGYTDLNEECTDTEREAIRQGIGSRLSTALDEPPQEDNKRLWKKLNVCLTNNTRQNEEPVDTVCRLKKSNSHLCDDHKVDQMTENFFNHEMEHLHCSCKAISAEAANIASSVPIPVRIGIAVGGLSLLIILVVVVIILCVRHRKVKRELYVYCSAMT